MTEQAKRELPNKMQGVVVTKEEVAAGLGFGSVMEMDKFGELIKLVQPQIRESFEKWFGKKPTHGQIIFEISSRCVEAFIHSLTTPEAQHPWEVERDQFLLDRDHPKEQLVIARQELTRLREQVAALTAERDQWKQMAEKLEVKIKKLKDELAEETWKRR